MSDSFDENRVSRNHYEKYIAFSFRACF